LSRTARDPRKLLAYRLAPFLAGLIALALYAATLPPGLTWANNGADGGDFLAAALTSGVPHPTGYPTYQLLLRLAVSLIGGEPARAGAWLSAICAALAVVFLADLAQRMVRERETTDSLTPPVAGFVAAVTWAASPGLWGQAVIVEVYALNALVCVASLWLAWRWAEGAAAGTAALPWLLALGLVLGVGLGNHLTVALMLPGLAAWVWMTTRANHLTPQMPRALGAAALAALAGLLVYAYLPLAASQRPPINWGDPATLDRVLWVATGRLYAGLAFGLPLPALPARLLGWATWSVRQFFPWGLLLALFGLWRLDRRLRGWWLVTLLVFFTFTLYALTYNTNDSLTYLLPAFAVTALWLAEGLNAAFLWLRSRPAAAVAILILAVLALPVASIAANWSTQDLRKDDAARAFMTSALAEAEPNAVILTAGDERTFALWYGIYGLGQRHDVALINVNLYGYDWYRRSLAETHPNLLPFIGSAPPLESLIARLAAEQPVYAAEDLGLALPESIGHPEPEGAAHSSGVLTRLGGPLP
jgi:4-amino-4-deoxy-L-arabinose transferase-like glycosyltransferase